ncbi:MAG: GNAT family N-acetyltransferase [Rhodanobacteraceae bacterium]
MNREQRTHADAPEARQRPESGEGDVVVRRARHADAAAAVDCVRRSIEQSCSADHHEDPPTLAAWLSNKTPANFIAWLDNPENHCVIAERKGRLCGVGLLHRSGKIRLFYIEPGSQRHGAGRAIHVALERQAHVWKLPRLHLDSTANARAFYEALGYHHDGPARMRVGVLQCFPYEKRFADASSMAG